MTITVPQPIAAYFDAKNRHDTAAILAPFTPDAIVYDDGGTYRGTRHDRRLDRADDQGLSRHARPSPELTQEGREIAVAALVAGDFTGSPAPFTYLFTLADDADGQIAALTIRYDG